jgi:integrase
LRLRAVERAEVRYAPPDLRHGFASLQIRAGMSIPELAEQMGHSPQMTLSTYAHVIQELKGAERVSTEEQIRRARRSGGPSACFRARRRGPESRRKRSRKG